MSHCARSIVRAGIMVAVAAAVSAAEAQDAVTLRPGNTVDFGDVVAGESGRRVVLLDSASAVSVRTASAPAGSVFRADLARQAGEVVLDVQFSPLLGQVGLLSDVVTVQLEGGGSATLAVRGTAVAAASGAPRFTSIPLSAAVVGREYAYATHVLAAAADGPVTYALEGAPAGMTITSNGVVRWTPAAGQAGLHDVTIVASNARGEARQPYTVVAMRIDVAAAAAPVEGAPAGSEDYRITVDVTVWPPRLVSIAQRAAEDRLRVEQWLAPGATHVAASGAAALRTTSAGTSLTWNLPLSVTQVAHTVRLPAAPPLSAPRPLTAGTHARLGLGAAADSLDVVSNLLRTFTTPTPQGLGAEGAALHVTDGVATVRQLDRATGAVQATRTIDLGSSTDVEAGLEPGRVALVQDSTAAQRFLAEFSGSTRVRQTRTDGFAAGLTGFAVAGTSSERFFATGSRLYRFDRHFGDHIAAPAGVTDVVGDQGGVVWAVGPTTLHRITDSGTLSFTLPSIITAASGVAVDGDRLLILDNASFRRVFEVTKPQAAGNVVQVLASTPAMFFSGSLVGLDRDPTNDELLLVSQEANNPVARRLGSRFGDHFRVGTAPSGVAEDVGGTWVVDRDRTVRLVGPAGNVLSSWTASAVGNPSGIGVRGDEVWITDESAGATPWLRYAYTYTKTGTLLRRTSLQHLRGSPQGVDRAGDDLLFTIDGSAPTPDHVTRVGAGFGDHCPAPAAETTGLAAGAAPGELWAVVRTTPTGLFRRATPTSGWTRMADLGTDPRGVAYDAARNCVWVVDGVGRLLSRYAVDGTLLGSVPVSATFGANPQGLDIDPVTREFLLVSNGLSYVYRIGEAWGTSLNVPTYPNAAGVGLGSAMAQDGGTRWLYDRFTGVVRRMNNDGTAVAGHTPFVVRANDGRAYPAEGMAADADHLLFLIRPSSSPATVLRYSRTPNLAAPRPVAQFVLSPAPVSDTLVGCALKNGVLYTLEDSSITGHTVRAFDAASGLAVAAFNPTGDALTTSVSITAAGGTNLTDLSISPSGNLVYLAADNGASRLIEIDIVTGAKLGETPIGPYGFSSAASASNPAGAFAQHEGKYYVYEELATDRLYVVDPAGLPWSDTTTAPTTAPTSVCAGAGGALHVTDLANVHRVGGTSFAVNAYGCGPVQGMTWDGEELQVAAVGVGGQATVENSDARIYAMAPTGLATTQYLLNGTSLSPRGATLGPAGNLFVVDATTGVHELTPTTPPALVRSFSASAYGSLAPSGISSNGTTLRVSDDPVGTTDPDNRLFTMDPGGLSVVTSPLTVGVTWSDIAASPNGTAVVVDTAGNALELARDGSSVATESLRPLGIFTTAGAGHDVNGLRFLDAGRIFRTSPDMVVLQEFDLSAYGIANVTGLTYDGEADRLFLSTPRTIWEACLDGAQMEVWPRVELGMFVHGGQPLGDASDVAVNRAQRELYVASAARNIIYVFSLAQHRAPNPARVLLLSQGDGSAFHASLRARGHDVVAADLAGGALAATLDATFTQVWIVGADPSAGAALSEVDLAALQAWTTASADRRHVVLDALAGRDQDPCQGIRYGQDLASVLELNGGGVLVTAGAEGAGGAGVASVNQALARLGLGGFSGAYVTAPATFRPRGDMITTTWLSSWFTTDQTHANLPEGVQASGRELWSSLEATYTSGAPSLADDRVVLLSSTIRSASGVADVVAPGLNEPVDRVPPTLTITAPAAGQLFTGPSRDVQVTLTYLDDVGVDQGSLVVTANGAPVTGFQTSATSASGTLTVAADAVVTLQATIRDLQGNPGSASVQFTVDTTGPTIVCADVTVEQANGAGTAVALAPTVTDSIDPSPTWSSDAPAVYPKGLTVVTITARDAAGHVTTEAVNVLVRDTTPPSIAAIADPAPFEQTSAAGAAITLPAANASDICDAGAQLSVVYTAHFDGDTRQLSSGDVLNLGEHTVTATVTDLSGNEASTTFTLVVQDTTAPIVQAGSLSREATDASGATVPAYDVTATDACDAAVALTFSREPGVFPIGATIVTGVAMDDSGNQTPFSFTVVVEDTTPPALTLPGPITAEQSNRDGTPVSFTRPTATDRGGSVSVPVTLSHEPGTSFPLGTTTVTASATDASGLTTTGTFTVTVVDTTAPSITAPAGIVVEATGPAGAAVSFTLPTATDICDAAPQVTCSSTPGDVFALGVHQVTCTATDATGNSADVTFTITVCDTTGPAITQADVEVEQASAAGTAVAFAPTAVDLVDGAVPAARITCEPASGSSFPLGPTEVTVTALDARGNATTRTFRVLVLDRTAPALTAPAAVSTEATGPSGAAVTFGAASASDVCDSSVDVVYTTEAGTTTPSTTVVPGDTFPLGATTVHVIARDDSGNTSVASFTVTVLDTTPPVLTLGGDVTVEQVDWRGTIVTYPAATAVDAVDPAPSIEYSIASGASFPLGATTVTVIATDARGNTTSSTFTVLVDDTTKPVVSAAPDLTASAVDGQGAVVTFDAPAATDACDANPVVVCTPPSGSLFPLGTTTVTCVARDSKNESEPVTFTVTVVDTTPPVFTQTPASLTVEQDRLNGAAVTFDLPAATDNVGAPTVTSEPPSGAVFQLGGPWTVTCTARDAAGNTATVSFTVTVVDTTPPVLTVPGPRTAEATGPAGAAVTFAPAATDVCDAAVAIECTPPSGSTFPLGTTTVAVRAVDASGNPTTGSFTVTVVDTTPPVITGLPGPIRAEQGHGDGIEVEFATPTATDTVDPAPVVTCTPSSGSVFPLGTTTVTVEARDAAGNVATAEFTVTVVDTTPPVLAQPSRSHLVVEQSSHAGALIPYSPSVQDACDANPDVTCSHELATPLPLGGPVTVSVSAVDFSGNPATIEFTVTVQDTTAPTLSIPGELILQSTGGPIPANDPRIVQWLSQFSASDICDSSPELASNHPLSFAPGSSTPVTFTATDGSGNAAQGTSTVRVLAAAGDPTIDITAPADGACLSAASVALTYVVTPSNTVVSVSGTLTKPNGKTRSVGPGPYTEEGDYVVTATAGSVSDTVHFSIDRTKPFVEIKSPKNNPHAGAYPYSQYRATLGASAACCEHDHGCGHEHQRGRGHDRDRCGRGHQCDDDGDRRGHGDDDCGDDHRGHGHGDDCDDDRRGDDCDDDRRGDGCDDRGDGCDRHGDDRGHHGPGHHQGRHDQCGHGNHGGGGGSSGGCERTCCSNAVRSDLPLRVTYRAHDDDGIAGDLQKVELVLDGLALPATTTALDAATFVRLGLPVLGRHTLLVRATDRAGNVGTDDVAFEIVLHADRCADVLDLSLKEEKVKVKGKKGKDEEKKEKLIQVRLDLPATLTGSPLDPVEADAVASTLRLEAVASGRQATAFATSVQNGVLVATFRQADLTGSGGFGTQFRLTGRFFSTSGPAFIAEGELNDK